MKNVICEKLGIKYPIIQGGMVWVSGARLAAAVSNQGGLGVLSAGSMNLQILEEQIKKTFSLTDKPFAVNLPLLYSKAQEQIELALSLGVKIFITSAGSPKKYTDFLKSKSCIVLHVVSSPALAKKCEDAGVDIIIAEGFEAGGHNGRDEITTMCLIPQTVDSVTVPVVAAGGISDHRGVNAAFALGAKGVQMGTRFLMTKESRAHDNYKNLLKEANPGSTKLSMKKFIPVRLYKNSFFEAIDEMESKGATAQELQSYLGKGRAKKGMHDGDIIEGELEVGQVCSQIKKIISVKEVFDEIIPKLQSF